MISATLSIHDATVRKWDVLIVGAGPAGATAAIAIAQKGLSVLLVDQSAFPRWKVCGSCVGSAALAVLDSLGLGELPVACGAVPLHSIRLHTSSRSADVGLGNMVALSREAFDAALVRRAIELGVGFLPKTHVSLAETVPGYRNARLTAAGGSFAVSCRIVLAADGLAGRLSRQASTRPMVANWSRIGLGALCVCDGEHCRSGVIYMACHPHGYVGMVRLEDGRLNVAAAINPGERRRKRHPAAVIGTILDETGMPAFRRPLPSEWRGTPALSRQCHSKGAERLFLIGDASGYVEPFTGEGIGWAMLAGRAVAPLAVRACQRWRPEFIMEWNQAYRRLLEQSQRTCAIVQRVMRHPALVEMCVYATSRIPALARPIVNLLHQSTGRIESAYS